MSLHLRTTTDRLKNGNIYKPKGENAKNLCFMFFTLCMFLSPIQVYTYNFCIFSPCYPTYVSQITRKWTSSSHKVSFWSFPKNNMSNTTMVTICEFLKWVTPSLLSLLAQTLEYKQKSIIGKGKTAHHGSLNSSPKEEEETHFSSLLVECDPQRMQLSLSTCRATMMFRLTIRKCSIHSWTCCANPGQVIQAP